jgi:hypothetical protein
VSPALPALLLASIVGCATPRAAAVDDEQHCGMGEYEQQECERIKALLARPPPVDTSPPVALGGLAFSPAPPPGTSPPEARALYQAGLDAMNGKAGARWDEAHQLLMGAYLLFPSRNILAVLGESAEHVELPAEALDAYELLLIEGKLDDAKRADIEARVAALRARTAVVTLHGLGGGVIDDTRVPASGPNVQHTFALRGPNAILRVEAGHHVVRSGVQYAEPWEIDVVAGAQIEHTFAPKLPADCAR